MMATVNQLFVSFLWSAIGTVVAKKNLNRARKLILTLGNKHWDRSIMLLHGVKLPKQKATGTALCQI